MKNIKESKSLKVAGLAMLVSLSLVGCSQQQVDSNVDKLVEEAIGETTEYELTYGDLPTLDGKGYTLNIKEHLEDKDSKYAPKCNALLILTQCIANNTNEVVEIDTNGKFLYSVSNNLEFSVDKEKAKNSSKLQEEANKFLIQKDLFAKGYSIYASIIDSSTFTNSDKNKTIYTLNVPNGEIDTNTVDTIADNLYKISPKGTDVEITVVEYLNETEYKYNQNNKPEISPETKVNEPKKSTSKGSIDVKGIEQYLQTGLEDALQSSNFKMSKEVEKDYLSLTVTLQDPIYSEYSDADLARIGDNMSNEGLRDLTFNAYKEYVKSETANFFFTLEDSTGRVIYKTNF